MYRSPKEQHTTGAVSQLLCCAAAEAAALAAEAWDGGEWAAGYTSASEQLKRTTRKPSR